MRPTALFLIAAGFEVFVKHCTGCGSKLPQPNPKHCPECGAATSAGAGVPKAKAVANAASQQEQRPTMRDRILAVIVILILAFLFFFFFGMPFGDSSYNPKPAPSIVPSFISTATPAPSQAGILAGAFFYKGQRPEPELVSYSDEQGNNNTVLALPGELLVQAPANARQEDVDAALSAIGVKYKILAAIPALGSYLIEVQQDQAAFFISMLHMLSKEYSAEPNFVLSAGDAPPVDLTNTNGSPVVDPSRLVDFSDDHVPACGELLYVPAFLGSPDPSAMVITTLIDNFNREDPSKPSHGENTAAALRANCGGCPMLKLDLGHNRVADDQIERALAAAVAGAEINGQDVVVSLSFGPSTVFRTANSQDVLDYDNKDTRNARAGREWEAFMKRLLNVLANSEWARAGHVRLHNSAGNGALLCDPPAAGETPCSNYKKIREDKGVDLTKPMYDLLDDPFYGPLMRNNVKVWCAYRHDIASLASYSNYGPKIDCKEPYDSLEGTSFSAPIGAGDDFLAVKQRLGNGPPITKVFPSETPACSANISTYSIPTTWVTSIPAIEATPAPTEEPAIEPTFEPTVQPTVATQDSYLCYKDSDCNGFAVRHNYVGLVHCASDFDHLCHSCFSEENLETGKRGCIPCDIGCADNPAFLCQSGICLWPMSFHTND